MTQAVLKSFLSRHHLYPKKSLGQHFLIDEKIFDAIVQAAELRAEDQVLEIGAGPGFLSERLAPRIRELISLEIDERMRPAWNELMKPFSNAQLLFQDALTYIPAPTPYKIVANIPYYITSPLLRHFLTDPLVPRPERIVFLIQKDVAERICDQKKPMLFSWEIKIFGEPEIIASVPPTAFFPQPKVESCVFRVILGSSPLIVGPNIPAFFQLLEMAYKHPRKTLLNNLIASGRFSKDEVLKILHQAKIPPTLRPHQLTLDDWKCLFLSSRILSPRKTFNQQAPHPVNLS